MKKTPNKKTSIGGSALIEGVMMRGVSETAMAVRLTDGTIDVEKWSTESEKSGKWYRKAPFIRGIFNLIDSLRLSYKCLMKAADKIGLEDEEPTKFEKFLKNKLGDKFTAVLTTFAGILAVVIAVFLFMLLPVYAVKAFENVVELGYWKNVIEGGIKILVFIIYIACISAMSEIKRVFQYHGAEHKSISCYEAGAELTPENAKNYSRFHPRCGTSFILIVLIIGILVFSLLPWGSALLRTAYKILLLPVVVGIAYEIIKLAGRYDNIFTRIISAPGICLQRLTTREPDEKQLEVAIASLKAVLPKEDEDDTW